MPDKFNIAVLIDGDNAQAKLLKEILNEVSKYGKATIRRIYGDWTNQTMSSWKETVNLYSINPMQKFSYTKGKNSTDSSMIIDAMDILHSRSVDGFCIVSSDSDYTGLAKRIREEGIFVMGIGDKKTPEAFVQSCEVFTYTENLTVEIITESRKNKKSLSEDNKRVKVEAKAKNKPQERSDQQSKHGNFLSSKDEETIDKAFMISIVEEDKVHISQVGINIRKIDPSFDPRAYGYSSLTKLFEHLEKYAVEENRVNGLNHPLVRLK